MDGLLDDFRCPWGMRSQRGHPRNSDPLNQVSFLPWGKRKTGRWEEMERGVKIPPVCGHQGCTCVSVSVREHGSGCGSVNARVCERVNECVSVSV